jgi:hypothetical protein
MSNSGAKTLKQKGVKQMGVKSKLSVLSMDKLCVIYKLTHSNCMIILLRFACH